MTRRLLFSPLTALQCVEHIRRHEREAERALHGFGNLTAADHARIEAHHSAVYDLRESLIHRLDGAV